MTLQEQRQLLKNTAINKIINAYRTHKVWYDPNNLQDSGAIQREEYIDSIICQLNKDLAKTRIKKVSHGHDERIC